MRNCYQVANHKTKVEDVSDRQGLEVEASAPVKMLPRFSQNDQVGDAAKQSWKNAMNNLA